MSSTWMNDAVPNHNGNNFPHMNDPNNAATAGAMMDPSAFLNSPAQFNPAQFPNQQQQQPSSQQPQMTGAQNGPMRNASPSFQNPVYQTNSVIPSKRPRPREDSLAGSPRQNSGMLPTSRSETPQQQNFPGFQPGAVQQQNPNQFTHLQANGSANASPSPIMGNQMRPGSVPQRVATASPHPFSPSTQQFGAQTSPIPSEQGTPQPYMQNMPQGYNANFAPSPSGPRPGGNPNGTHSGQMTPQQIAQMQQQMGQMGQMSNNMYAQMQMQQQQQQQMAQQPGQPGQQPPQPGQPRQQQMTDQQRMAAYQMQLQQRLQGSMQGSPHMQGQAMGRGMMNKQPMPGMPNGQVPQGGMRPQQHPQQQQQRPHQGMNPESFMKNLVNLMNAKGLPLDPSPMVGDRPVNLMMLFQAVSSKGGYKMATGGQAWGAIAQALGLPAHIPTVPQTLKQVYERNLLKFEEVWTAQQKQRMMQMQQAQQAQQAQQQQPQAPQQQHQQQSQGQQQPPGHQQHPQQHTPNMAHPGTPQRPMPPQQSGQGQMQPGLPGPGQQTPSKPGQPGMNGFSTPQMQHQQPPHTPQQAQQQQPQGMGAHSRNSMSRDMDPSAGNDYAVQSPAHVKMGSMSMPPGDPRLQNRHGSVAEPLVPRPLPKSDDYTPCARELSSWGGVDVAAAAKIGEQLEMWRPNMPHVQELGHIDIPALTRSLQSGIHGEVRLALDTLASVSNSPNHAHFLQLAYCDDLVDVMVDLAEEQLDALTEHTAEVSDEIQLNAYEDQIRLCRQEQFALREEPVFGTKEYDLDRAVDRLLCITTIFRNTSFPGEMNENHHALADETVLKLLCSIIRYLGTRTMLLRTHANTLDLMKDLVVLLSNIAGAIELPNREHALSLLYFLLAFAPNPAPLSPAGSMEFSPYDPTLQPYLPHAVDALAKLLARDEPNRTHFKTLFALDAANSPAHELLTRTFALAISPIPDKLQEKDRPPHFPPLVEVRKPFLMQGLLSADILASLAPNYESGLVKSWLSASGGQFTPNLFRIVRELSRQFDAASMYGRGPPRGQPRKDPELLYIVMIAVSLLRRLAEKARDPSAPGSAIPLDYLPSNSTLFEATTLHSPDWTREGLLQQLTSFHNLGA